MSTQLSPGLEPGEPQVTPAPPPAPSCPSCGSAVERHYCPECGERHPREVDFSFKGLLQEAAHAFSPVDGTILPTLRALFTRPGLLTAEYFAGRRRRYMRPLAFFLVVNVAFFLVVPYLVLYRYGLEGYIDVQAVQFRSPDLDLHSRIVSEHLAATGETLGDFERRFEATLLDQRRGVLLFSIPLFALALQLLYAGRRRFFAEHLVFAIHTYAFFLAFLGFGLTLAFGALQLGLLGLHHLGIPVGGLSRALASEWALMGAIFLGLGGYLRAAVMRFYGDGPRRAVAIGLGLVVVQQLLTLLYRETLFWSTLVALGAWRPWS